MEGQCAVPHVVQDTNTQTGTTALRRIPMIDPQPHTPSRLTFEAQDTVTNVAEPTIIDHGGHNGSRGTSRKRVNRGAPNSDWGVEDRSPAGEVVEGGNAGELEETGTVGCGQKGQRQQGGRRRPRQKDAAEMQKGKGALEGNGRQQRTDLVGRHNWGLKDKNVEERHALEGNTQVGPQQRMAPT